MQQMLAVILTILSIIGASPKTYYINEIELTYELYSWQEPIGALNDNWTRPIIEWNRDWEQRPGEWNFCVLITTSSEKSVQAVFSDKNRLRGIQALKEKLVGLPSGTKVYWITRLPTDQKSPKAKGSESLASPPPELVKDILDFADAHNIKIDPPWEYRNRPAVPP